MQHVYNALNDLDPKHKFASYFGEHVHYIGTKRDHLLPDHSSVQHGKPVTRTYNDGGHWYAVHTH